MNVSLKKLTDTLNRLQAQINALSGAGSGGVASVNGETGAVVLDASDVGAVQSIVAGSNVTVDDTDPQHPIVSATGGGGATSARWWRLLIGSSISANNTVCVLEAEFRSSAGGGNLCTGGIAAASSEYSSAYNAGVAFDGDTTNAGSNDVWASARGAALPQWLGYELPIAATINEIKIWNRIAAGASPPRDFIVQSSADSTNGANGIWVDEWAVVDQTGWAAGEVRTFTRPGL